MIPHRAFGPYDFLFRILFQVLFSACVIIGVVNTILFQGTCSAPLPCTCSSYQIHCENKNLTQVPIFTTYTDQYFSLRIYLHKNELRTIPPNSFKNLSTLNATDIQIELYNNRLYEIDSQAFSGIQNAITLLDLGHNNFTNLPSGLLILTTLKYLYIDGNPLTTLDSTEMSKLGGTIETFSITVDRFTTFPNELHYLSRLTSLTVDTNVDNSNLHYIPQVIVGLSNLKYLHLSGKPLCSCSEMSSLMSWNVMSIDIQAKCQTGEDLKMYLTRILPKCPHPSHSQI